MGAKKLKTKVIAVGLTGVVVSGVVLNQQFEIRQLEKDLQIQQNITDQKHNYTETIIDISSLKERLNEECSFKVLDSTINIRHTYSYKRDSILGFKSEYKLVGTADFYYALVTDLSQSTIMKATDEKIIIEEYPPATVKLTITGKGNATKEELEEVINRILKTEIDNKNLDVSDALGVALCHINKIHGKFFI